MSKDQTTQPAQRMRLSLASGPNPPWTGQVFACEDCGATFQLCASDDLKELPSGTDGVSYFEAPPCWTCGEVNVIRCPSPSTWQPEGNPS